MSKRAHAWAAAFFLLLAIALAACGAGAGADSRQTVKIAVPNSKFIQNIETNYYARWLEEQSGLNIEFVFISETNTEEYLRLLFSSVGSELDAVFFSPELYLSHEVLQQYGEQGYILPLNAYVEAGETRLSEVFDGFHDYDLRAAMTAADGKLYYMPSLNTAQLSQNRQVLWMNTDWVKALGLSLPQTTEDFREVLEAFQTGDPNRDGRKNEIPIAASAASDATEICTFLINAFTYYDPQTSGLAVVDGRVVFTPATDEYRAAMVYLNSLYADGLLDFYNFDLSQSQFRQMVNDPRNMVGCFTSGSITDVIYRSSTDVLSNYIHVPPLAGPSGGRYAQPTTALPIPGGVITATCQNPQAVFRLMDLMLSEEASLIACYGEQGVDWDFAATGDIAITGGRAVLNVKTRLGNTLQNKHLDGIGPLVIREEYADYVNWSGMEADNEYLNGRAAVSYQPYEPKENLPLILLETENSQGFQETRRAIEAYGREMLTAFVTGEKDATSDAVWQQFVDGYEQLGLQGFIGTVQAAYDYLLEWRETH
ncbi:extracellular solute-binding protein [Ruminococcaceae bacterium OttesenSCG-928-D13]|nr:extracellular solute-binding protein [Ruminococcaceae bacterium OttesenSCG-928-D13]